MYNYQKLDAWKVSMQLVKEIYMESRIFPKEELYSLTSQLKRAAISIPANITEGMGRQYKKDTVQFLHISRGSVYELETLLNIALMVGVMNTESFNNIIPLCGDTIKLLNGLINYTEKADLK